MALLNKFILPCQVSQTEAHVYTANKNLVHGQNTVTIKNCPECIQNWKVRTRVQVIGDVSAVVGDIRHMEVTQCYPADRVIDNDPQRRH